MMAMASTTADTRNREPRTRAASLAAHVSSAARTSGSARGRPVSASGRTESRKAWSSSATVTASMLDVPKAVRIASPTAMPTIRPTVTAALAVPNAARPAASTAAVERGVTVSPNPSPKRARVTATYSPLASAVSLASTTSPTIEAASPTIVTAVAPRRRIAKPETAAPSAIARASAPRTVRCSSGPAKRTRSTNAAMPTMTVASA